MLFSKPSEAENLLAAVQAAQISYSCVTGGVAVHSCAAWVPGCTENMWFSEAFC